MKSYEHPVSATCWTSEAGLLPNSTMEPPLLVPNQSRKRKGRMERRKQNRDPTRLQRDIPPHNYPRLFARSKSQHRLILSRGEGASRWMMLGITSSRARWETLRVCNSRRSTNGHESEIRRRLYSPKCRAIATPPCHQRGLQGDSFSLDRDCVGMWD